jgi:hypothetical protein
LEKTVIPNDTSVWLRFFKALDEARFVGDKIREHAAVLVGPASKEFGETRFASRRVLGDSDRNPYEWDVRLAHRSRLEFPGQKITIA